MSHGREPAGIFLLFHRPARRLFVDSPSPEPPPSERLFPAFQPTLGMKLNVRSTLPNPAGLEPLFAAAMVSLAVLTGFPVSAFEWNQAPFLWVLVPQTKPAANPGAQAASPPRAEWTALGPFFESAPDSESGEWRQALLRPLMCSYKRRDGWARGRDFLWPLALTQRLGRESHQRILLALHTNRNLDRPKSPERWWLLPVFFFGRDRNAHPYFACFPIGGRIAEVIGLDQVRFLLFPLYLDTRKGRITSQTLLWPIFSRTRGPHLRKWRVFPLYGQSRTPEKSQEFLLWPIFHHIRTRRNGGRFRGHGFFVLPAGGFQREKDRHGRTTATAWTVLWPFFSGLRSSGQRKLDCPWPFLQFETRRSGPVRTLERRYFWPIYGTQARQELHGGREHYRFLLWPFFHYRTEASGPIRSRSLWLLPFYWEQQTRRAGHTLRRYRHIWPLWRSVRWPGGSRMECLALWPGRAQKEIDRCYTPLWRPFFLERGPRGLRVRIFWGAVEWRKARRGDRCFHLFPLVNAHWGRKDRQTLSFLAGAFRLNRRGRSARCRLLWLFHFGWK